MVNLKKYYIGIHSHEAIPVPSLVSPPPAEPIFISAVTVNQGGNPYLRAHSYEGDVLSFAFNYTSSAEDYYDSVAIHPHRNLVAGVSHNAAPTLFVGRYGVHENVFIDELPARGNCFFTDNKLFICPHGGDNRFEILDLDTWEFEDPWYSEHFDPYSHMDASRAGYVFIPAQGDLHIYDWKNRSFVTTADIENFGTTSIWSGRHARGPSARPDNTCVIVRGPIVALMGENGAIWYDLFGDGDNINNNSWRPVTHDFESNVYFTGDQTDGVMGLHKLDKDGNHIWSREETVQKSSCSANNAGRIVVHGGNSIELWDNNGNKLDLTGGPEGSYGNRRILEMHPGRYGMFGIPK